MDIAARLMAVEPPDAPARPDRVHFTGWGVTALRFADGHALALRVFPCNPLAPMRAVWHRAPSGDWALYLEGTVNEAMLPHTYGRVLRAARDARIMLAWPRRDVLHVRVDSPALDWTLHLAPLRWRHVLNRIAARLPHHLLGPDTALGAARSELVAALDPGTPDRSAETAPGRVMTTRPRDVWGVTRSTAVLDGIALGEACAGSGRNGDRAGLLVQGEAFMPAGLTKV